MSYKLNNLCNFLKNWRLDLLLVNTYCVTHFFEFASYAFTMICPLIFWVDYISNILLARCLLIVLVEFSHRFVHCFFNVLIMGVAGSICKSEYSFVFIFIASLMIILTVIYLISAFCRCFIPLWVTRVYII